MKRREFLRLTSYLSIGSSLGIVPQLGFANAQSYIGPFVISLEAGGGWDPTSFCDPKGRGNGSSKPINTYDATDIGKVGNIRYAPAPDMHKGDSSLYSCAKFFGSHYKRLLVLNGVDMKTNDHHAGQRVAWTGNQASGFPNVSALLAGTRAPNVIMPFLTFGGTDKTANVVAPSRVNGEGINAIQEVAYNNYVNVENRSETYFNNNIENLIATAHSERSQRLRNEKRLLAWRQSMERFIETNSSGTETLQSFVNNLKTSGSINTDDFNGRRDALKMFQSGRSALAAFETGSAVTAHISLEGFDTHNDHDSLHYPLLMDYLKAADGIIKEAERRGLADRLIIVMNSDFGRTNSYNSKSGKDHDPISSTMFWGAPTYFSGNRVIGETDVNRRPKKIDPQTMATNSNGVRMEPEDLHRSMRRLFGIENNDVSRRFDVKGRDLNFFS